MTHTAILRSFFERAWNQKDESAIDDTMAEDTITHGLGEGDMIGREPFREFYRMFHDSFDSIRITIDQTMEEGDYIAYRATARATLSPSRTFTVAGAGFTRMRHGRFAESWNYWDFHGLLTQMGVVAPDALVKAIRSAG